MNFRFAFPRSFLSLRRRYRRFARKSRLHRRSLSSFMALLFLVQFVLAPTGVFAQTFDRLDEDVNKNRIGDYANAVEGADDEDDWNEFVSSGADLLRAEWEYRADLLLEQEVTAGAAREDLEAEKALAREAWEAELDDEIDQRRGRWRARTAAQSLDSLLDDIDYDELVAAVNDANALMFTDADDAATRVAAWDAIAGNRAALAKAAWESQLDAEMAALQSQGAGLSAEEQAAFLSELERVRTQVESVYKVEESAVVTSSRRKFVTEANTGDDLARSLAQSTDPAEIARLLVRKTELEMERLGVLPGDVRFDGVDAQLILTGAGDYQDQVSQALEAGQSAWKSAIDELIARKIGFDEQVAASRQAGENQWATAYATILDARESWLTDVEAQIQRGLQAWDAAESELAENRQLAEAELARLIENDRRDFQEHNRGIAQLVSGASSTLATIVENQRWFSTKIADLHADITRLDGESQSYAGGIHPIGTPGWVDQYNWHRAHFTDAEINDRFNRINTYTAELSYWNSLEGEYRQIIADAEGVVHSQDMRDGGNGPGYFHDAGTGGDALLLTATEFELKLARARLAVLEEERDRAQAVLDYAVATTKDGAVDIQTQLAAAKSSYEAAESAYLTELAALNGGGSQSLARVGLDDESTRESGDAVGGATLLDDVNALASDLEAKARTLERSRTALDNARDAYEQTLKLQVLIQNPSMLSDIGLLATDSSAVNEDGENEGLRYEIFRAETDLGEAREKLRQQEQAYLRLMYERETALRSKGFFNQTNERIILHEQTKDKLAQLSAVLGGAGSLSDKLTALSSGSLLADIYGNAAADQFRDRIADIAAAVSDAEAPVATETNALNGGLAEFGTAHGAVTFGGGERDALSNFAGEVGRIVDALDGIAGVDWGGGLDDLRTLGTALTNSVAVLASRGGDYDAAYATFAAELSDYESYAAANAGAEASAAYQARTARLLSAADEFRLAAARFEQEFRIAQSMQQQAEILLGRTLGSAPILIDASITGDARSAALQTISAEKLAFDAAGTSAFGAIETGDDGFAALAEAFGQHAERVQAYRSALGGRSQANLAAGSFVNELHETLRGSLASQRSQLAFLLEENADEMLLDSMQGELERGQRLEAAEINVRALELTESYLASGRSVNILLIEVTEAVNALLNAYDVTDGAQRRELAALQAVGQYLSQNAQGLALLDDADRAEVVSGLADERAFAEDLRDWFAADGLMSDAEQLAIRTGGSPVERRLLSAFFNPAGQMVFGQVAFAAAQAEAIVLQQHADFAAQVNAGLVQSAMTDRYHEDQENKITGLIAEMKAAVPALNSLTASQLYNDSAPVSRDGLAHDTDEENARKAVLASLLSGAGASTEDRLTALTDMAQLVPIFGAEAAVSVFAELQAMQDAHSGAAEELARASRALVNQGAAFDAEVDALLGAYGKKSAYVSQRDALQAVLDLADVEDASSPAVVGVPQADVDTHVASLGGGDDPAVDFPADWTPVDDADGDAPGDAAWDPTYTHEDGFVTPFAGLDFASVTNARNDLDAVLADWDANEATLSAAVVNFRAAKATFDAAVVANPAGTPGYDAALTDFAVAVNDMYFAYRAHNEFFVALEFLARDAADQARSVTAAAKSLAGLDPNQQLLTAAELAATPTEFQDEVAASPAAYLVLAGTEDAHVLALGAADYAAFQSANETQLATAVRASDEGSFAGAAAGVGFARERYTEAVADMSAATAEADALIAALPDRVDVRLDPGSTDEVSAATLVSVVDQLRIFFAEKQAAGEEVNPAILDALEAAGGALDELEALRDFRDRGASVSVEDAKAERTAAEEARDDTAGVGALIVELQQFISQSEASGAGLHEQGDRIKELLAKYEAAQADFAAVYAFSAELDDAMSLLRDHAWAQHKRELTQAFLGRRGDLSVDAFLSNIEQGRFVNVPGANGESISVDSKFLGTALDATQLSELEALLREYAARARVDDAGIVADIDALLAQEDAAVRAAVEPDALTYSYNNFNALNTAGVGDFTALPAALKDYGLVSAYESYTQRLGLGLNDADDRATGLSRFLDTLSQTNRAAAEPVLQEYLTNYDARNPSYYLPADLKDRFARERYFAKRYSGELTPGDAVALGDWLAQEKFDAGVSGAVESAVRTAYVLDNFYGEDANEYLTTIDADLSVLTGSGVSAEERQAFVLGLSGMLSAAGDPFIEPDAMLAGTVIYDNFLFEDNTQALKDALDAELANYAGVQRTADAAATRAGLFFDYKSGAKSIRSYKSYLNIAPTGLSEPDEATQIAGMLAELEHQAEHRLGAFVSLVEQYSSFAYNADPAYANNLNIRDTIGEIKADFALQDGQYARAGDGSYVFEAGLNNTQVRLDEFVNANTAAFTAADRDAYAQVQKQQGAMQQLQETIITAGQEAVQVSWITGTFGSDTNAYLGALDHARQVFANREADFDAAENDYKTAESALRTKREEYRAQQDTVLANYNALRVAEVELDRLSSLYDQATIEEYSQQTDANGDTETLGDPVADAQVRFDAAQGAYEAQLAKIAGLEEKLARQVTKTELAAAAEVQLNRDETEKWAMHAMRFSRAEERLEDKINQLHADIEDIKSNMEQNFGAHFDISMTRFDGYRQEVAGYLDYGSSDYVRSENLHRDRFRLLNGLVTGQIGFWDLAYSQAGGYVQRPIYETYTDAEGEQRRRVIGYTDNAAWSTGIATKSGGEYDLFGFVHGYNQGRAGQNETLRELAQDQFLWSWEGDLWAGARTALDTSNFDAGVWNNYTTGVLTMAAIFLYAGAAGLPFLFQLYGKDQAFMQQAGLAYGRFATLTDSANELKQKYAELHRLTDIDTVDQLRDVLDDDEFGLTAEDLALIDGSGGLGNLVWKGGKEDLGFNELVGSNGLTIAQQKAIHDEYGFFVRDGTFSAGAITATPTETDKFGRRTTLMISGDEFTDAMAAMAQTQYEIERQEYFRAAETMTKDRVQADDKVILDEREEFYAGLLTQAQSVGVEYEMYRVLAEDYHGEGGIVEQVAEIEFAQRVEAQQNEWDLREEQFAKKRQEWEENIARLTSVGEERWSDMTTEVATAWNKWRQDFDAQARDAEDLYLERIGDAVEDQQEWQDEFTNLATQGADEQTLRELYDEINAMVAGLKTGLPDDVSIDLNANEILNQVLANKPDTLSEDMILRGQYANTQLFVNELREYSFDNSIQDRYDELTERYEEQTQRLVRLQMLDSLYGLIDMYDETIAKANLALHKELDLSFSRSEWMRMGPVYAKFIKTPAAVITGGSAIPVYAPTYEDYQYIKPDLTIEAIVNDANGREWNLTETEKILADDGPSGAELEAMVRLVRNKLQKDFEEHYDPDEEVDYEASTGLIALDLESAFAASASALQNPLTCSESESMDECARSILTSGYTVGLVEGGTFGWNHFETFYRALATKKFFDQMEAEGQAARNSVGARMGRDLGNNITAPQRAIARNASWALDTFDRNIDALASTLQLGSFGTFGLTLGTNDLKSGLARYSGAMRDSVNAYDKFHRGIRVGMQKGWTRNDTYIDAAITVALTALSFIPVLTPFTLTALAAYKSLRGSYQGGTRGALVSAGGSAASVLAGMATGGTVSINAGYSFHGGYNGGISLGQGGASVGVNYSEQGGYGMSAGANGVSLRYGEQGSWGVSAGGLSYDYSRSGGHTYGVDVAHFEGESGSVTGTLTYNNKTGTGVSASAQFGTTGKYGTFGGNSSVGWSRFGGVNSNFGLSYTAPNVSLDFGLSGDEPVAPTNSDEYLLSNIFAGAASRVDEWTKGIAGAGDAVAGFAGSALGFGRGGFWEKAGNFVSGGGFQSNAAIAAASPAAVAARKAAEDFTREYNRDRYGREDAIKLIRAMFSEADLVHGDGGGHSEHGQDIVKDAKATVDEFLAAQGKGELSASDVATLATLMGVDEDVAFALITDEAGLREKVNYLAKADADQKAAAAAKLPVYGPPTKEQSRLDYQAYRGQMNAFAEVLTGKSLVELENAPENMWEEFLQKTKGANWRPEGALPIVLSQSDKDRLMESYYREKLHEQRKAEILQEHGPEALAQFEAGVSLRGWQDYIHGGIDGLLPVGTSSTSQMMLEEDLKRAHLTGKTDFFREGYGYESEYGNSYLLGSLTPAAIGTAGGLLSRLRSGALAGARSGITSAADDVARISDDLLPPKNEIALGLSWHKESGHYYAGQPVLLEKFSEKVGAPYWKQWPGAEYAAGGDPSKLTKYLLKNMEEADVIHFNMDQFSKSGYKRFVKRWGENPGPLNWKIMNARQVTAWEYQTILSNSKLLEKTRFYAKGGRQMSLSELFYPPKGTQ